MESARIFWSKINQLRGSGMTTKANKRGAQRKKTTKRKTKKRVERKPVVRKTTTAARKAGKKVAPKRPVGRPTKYSKAIAERLPSMFENGESVVEVCVALGITKQTFYRWVDEKPEFSDAYEKGKEISEAWWTRLARGGSTGQVKVQPATLIFNLKNRFGWKDRIETEHTGEFAGKLVIGGPEVDVEEWEAAAKKQQEIMRGGTEA